MPVLTQHTANFPASMARSLYPGCLFLLLFFLPTIETHGQVSVAKEFQVKALFLYNFTHFVQWPQESFSDPDAPLVIGILGEDPFGPYIDELVKGEAVNNHPIVVERYASIEDVDHCHVLFINFAEKNTVKRTLDSLQARPILTVGDVDNFARMGGIIRFVREDERIGLRINTTAAAEAQLVISSKLLRLSEIVTGNNN